MKLQKTQNMLAKASFKRDYLCHIMKNADLHLTTFHIFASTQAMFRIFLIKESYSENTP